MTIRLLSYNLIISTFVILISCNGKAPNVSSPLNDTTEIIRILIDSTINLPRLSDINRLYKNNPFNRSIIINSDSAIYQRLPSTYKFKLLTLDRICDLAKQYNDSSDFPNYLEFGVWKNSDSVYHASVKNMRIENRSNCLRALNQGCFKYMTFRKRGNHWISKIEPTLYD